MYKHDVLIGEGCTRTDCYALVIGESAKKRFALIKLRLCHYEITMDMLILFVACQFPCTKNFSDVVYKKD